jgi:hypothetical protein
MGWEIWLLPCHLVRWLQTPLTPWRGTAQQWNAAIALALLLAFAGVVFSVWQRHGVAGVVQWYRQRAAAQRAYRHSEKGRAVARWSLVAWIGVAVVLVALFNACQNRGTPQVTRSVLPSTAMR